MPLPVLKIEATDGGSLFRIRNNSTAPLSAFIIELVGYPGSYYISCHDFLLETPVAPGAEKKIPTTNMTIGAAPEYVKLQAAVYADSSTAGTPEKVALILDARRAALATAREWIAKGPDTTAVALRQAAEPLVVTGRERRNAQLVVTRAASRALLEATAKWMDAHPGQSLLKYLKTIEKTLAESKPAL